MNFLQHAITSILFNLQPGYGNILAKYQNYQTPEIFKLPQSYFLVYIKPFGNIKLLKIMNIYI